LENLKSSHTNAKDQHQEANNETLLDYQLEDCFNKQQGRVFLTGTQALVAILLQQKRLDEAAGINTEGFISGYRGSPLGAVDQAIWRANDRFEQSKITFLPAINEDLAATAVLGTQQLEVEPDKTVDGVFSMWYGKGPGVDRAGDALKHGNAYGSSPHGGVLVVAGDDHGCASSSMSHQSDVAFMSAYIPTLNPASIAEYLEFGAYGYAMSRYSGMWVGFKAISETVEGGSSVEMPTNLDFKTPENFDMPEGGLNYRWPDLPGMQIETRMQSKKEAVRVFARANPIDRTIFNVSDAKYGIITTGKAHYDVMEALALLGIDKSRAHEIGLDVYKIGLVWPLEHVGAEAFMAGKKEVLVVEEKRGIIESQLKEYLYDRAVRKPELILGKHDENGAPLISWVDEMAPSILLPILARRLEGVFPELDFTPNLAELELAKKATSAPGGAKRIPYFCSGCPHNTSTKVPEGSKALAGIGCHFMASWMDRDTTDLIQMGGEGVNWAAKSRYLKSTDPEQNKVGGRHIFQNLGDGTYYHSGYMAIRQAIAAQANITYKILYNDAVAMTGGQPVDGTVSVGQMASQVIAEGAKKVVIVSDDPQEIMRTGGYPAQVELKHRDELDAVQREVREIAGVTVIIYVQTCAAEKRRKRKRGLMEDPAKRVIINDLVCEGCGDCSIQSNCLSIVPKETELGRKRSIDQSSCNKDFSCVKGFCPSFITVEGGQLKKPQVKQLTTELYDALQNLPEPKLPELSRVYDLLVAGVGGTGVVTIGAIITMAAHLENKGASVLDFMGFAQKGGTVLSYVRLANAPEDLNQVRIDVGAAQAGILCDLVVGTDERALRVMREGQTRVVANTHILPTADFIQNRSIDFQAHLRVKSIKDRCGKDHVTSFNANAIALSLINDTVFSNMMLLGYAWQAGLVPISEAAIQQAIILNGVAVEKNSLAFSIGRAAFIDLDLVNRAAGLTAEIANDSQSSKTIDDIVKHRARFLKDYQNQDYSERYVNVLKKVSAATEEMEHSDKLNRAVAKNLFKLMAYKDEYEVARLHTDSSMSKRLAEEFEGKIKLKYHLAPPVFNSGLDAYGRPKKTEFGSWMLKAFAVMKHFKFLRGTAFDPFGRSAERKMERFLIDQYAADMIKMVENLDERISDEMLEFAELPDQIRGFGPVKMKAIKLAESNRKNLLIKLQHGDDPTNSMLSENNHSAEGIIVEKA